MAMMREHDEDNMTGTRLSTYQAILQIKLYCVLSVF